MRVFIILLAVFLLLTVTIISQEIVLTQSRAIVAESCTGNK